MRNHYLRRYVARILNKDNFCLLDQGKDHDYFSFELMDNENKASAKYWNDVRKKYYLWKDFTYTEHERKMYHRAHKMLTREKYAVKHWFYLYDEQYEEVHHIDELPPILCHCLAGKPESEILEIAKSVYEDGVRFRESLGHHWYDFIETDDLPF